MDLEEYDLLPVTEVNRIESPIEETLYDITTDGDHTFFIYLPNSGDTVLVHNCDGIHICEIYLGWWMKLIPDLFNQKRICRLVTPLAVLYSDASKSKVIKYFFSLAEYKQYETKYPDKVKRGKVNYYKGLGSWGKSEFQKLFSSSPNGIEDFLEPIVFGEKPKDEDILDSWLSDKWADRRKDYLRNYNLDINQV